jgi:succinate dehydrogenase / fumarate reductase flavoprotein subunit
MTLESKIPAGTVADKWTQYKSTVPLVNPSNKRQLEINVVGTGLAGASAAATLA